MGKILKSTIVVLLCVLTASCSSIRTSVHHEEENRTDIKRIGSSVDLLNTTESNTLSERMIEQFKGSTNITLVLYDTSVPSDSNGKCPIMAELNIENNTDYQAEKTNDSHSNISTNESRIENTITEEHTENKSETNVKSKINTNLTLKIILFVIGIFVLAFIKNKYLKL